MIGNFLGDFILPSKAKLLPEMVKQGIALHRFIDEFTDNHEVVKETKLLIRPYFGKYAPVVADVFYDYFLGKNWKLFYDVNLKEFSIQAYRVLTSANVEFPEKAKRFLHYMTTNNILPKYATHAGMHQVFSGMAYRAKFKSNMEQAADVLKQHETDLEQHFSAFFPELKQQVFINFFADE